MTLPMRMIRYLGRGTSGTPCCNHGQGHCTDMSGTKPRHRRESNCTTRTLRKVGMRIPNTRRQIQLATRAEPTATRPATPPQTPPVLRGSQGRRAERQAGTGTCARTTRSDPCGRAAATGLGNLQHPMISPPRVCENTEATPKPVGGLTFVAVLNRAGAQTRPMQRCACSCTPAAHATENVCLTRSTL